MNYGTLLKRERFWAGLWLARHISMGHDLEDFMIYTSQRPPFFFFLQEEHNDLPSLVSYLYLNDTRCLACSVSANRVKKKK